MCFRNLIQLVMGVVVCPCLAWINGYGTEFPGETAVVVRSAEEVIQKWSGDQHLYVKGELGISEPQLAGLEKWLDENGPHWTVVLMRSAEDEVYTSMDRQKYFGMDAVEYALGHGLHNRTKFGGLIHPETGETSGAVFVLFLEERKFSYYGSDVHDRRALGEAKWVGDLDREAIRAMRNGGRILDAVKNTVNLIDSRLKKKLGAEANARQRAVEAAERALNERKRELENLRFQLQETKSEWIERIETQSRELRAQFPKAADSKLAQPPIAQWQLQLNQLESELAKIKVDDESPYQQSGEFRTLIRSVNEVRGEMDYFLDLYAAHRSFDEIVAPIEQQLDWVADHPSGAAIAVSDEAYRILIDARLGHEQGEISFADDLKQVKDLIARGEQAIDLEQQRIQQERERSAIIRRTLTIAASVVAALILALLWFLNLRRRPALRKAHEVFDRRSKIVETEIGHLKVIVNRCDHLVGTTSEFDARKYDGQTRQLGLRSIAYRDQLADMIDEATGLITAADTLLHPQNPIAEFANMFSSSRYEHCVGLLVGESLRFKPGDGGSPRFVTTERFFQEAQRIGGLLDHQLDTLETAFHHIDEKISELDSKLDTVIETEKKLARTARLDRLFRVPSLFEQLIPAAQADFRAANALAATDPVEAISGPVQEGLRKLNQGGAIAQSLLQARDGLIPELQAAGKQLKESGFDIRWIDEALEGISQRAEDLTARAVNGSVEAEIEVFQMDLEQLRLRGNRCVELAMEITETVFPSLNQLDQEIQEQRSWVAGQLGLQEPSVLHEVNYDPDVELEQARKQLDSARAALDYGGVESVMESLSEVEIESATARQLVVDSVSAVKAFDSQWQDRQSRLRQLNDRVPEVTRQIEVASKTYAASAMAFRDIVESSTSSTAPETVHQRKAEIDGMLELAPQLIEEAQAIHQSGRVLEAANLLQLMECDFEQANTTMDEISEHCRWLDSQARENRLQLEQHAIQLQTVTVAAREPGTQPETLAFLEQLASDSSRFEVEFESGDARDPFQDLQRLRQLQNDVQQLNAMVEADRRAHARAADAVDGAKSELAAARRSVIRSENDRIPDSQTILSCQQQVSRLGQEVELVAKQIEERHAVWQEVHDRAVQLTAELGVIDGQLRRELQLAQAAVAELNQASQQVFQSASWRGSYGIRIIGEPGRHELDVARQYLADGKYDSSIEASRLAAFNAKQAMDVARRQVANRRAEIARQAAEARRRRRRSSSGISFGSGSFGSSSRSSSFRSSSRSSSFSRSSSSSGSGFRRSGW